MHHFRVIMCHVLRTTGVGHREGMAAHVPRPEPLDKSGGILIQKF